MCDHCEVMYINGIKCHEIGCPVAYLDYTAECRWCGQKIKPYEGIREPDGRSFCDNSCYCYYYNLPCEENDIEESEED